MTHLCPLTRITLGSASPRRSELLRSLGLEVAIVHSGYDEPELDGLTPPELARTHARQKLAWVLAKGPHDGAVVAADTVVDVDGVPFNKPLDAADAARMLRELAGRDHLVHTAFALSLPGRASRVLELSTTLVRFHPLDDDEIAEYVATGEPFDKAGAYGIQGRAAALVESIDGDFYTVMGFPLGRFVRTLRRLGFSLPVPKER